MMKKVSMMAGVLGALAFLMALASWAQQQAPAPAAAPASAAPASPAAPAHGKGAQFYNLQAVETVAGKVVAVNRISPKKAGRPERVNLVLQTAQGNLKVQLGPADYFDKQALKLAAGDQVEVKGVRVNRPKATMFLAGEVKKGDQVLKLRDDATGRPLWATGKKGTGRQ